MKSPEIDFHGKGETLLWINIVNLLLGIVTIGFNIPWAICRYHRWKARNTTVKGMQLIFRGKGSELFGLYFVVVMFSIFTLTLYLPFGLCKIRRWLYQNTYIAEDREIKPVDI